MSDRTGMNSGGTLWAILLWLLIFLMSGYVVYEHATDHEAVSLNTLKERHERMIAGDSEFYNPWQYRVLSSWIVEGTIRFFEMVWPHGNEFAPFLFLHFIQIVLIFYASEIFYRRLGLHNPYLVLLGLILLCYSMSASVFRSDLSFNTYFDVAFYLMAAVFLLSGSFIRIIPLTLVAALNRESSGFIPLMAIFPFAIVKWKIISRRVAYIGGASLLIFAIVFLVIRLYFGLQPAVGIHGMSRPLEFFAFNISFFRMYPELLGTLSVLPIIVFLNFRKLHPVLINWLWLIAPAWIVIHLFGSTAVETRLFLMPQALIFIPGFLCLVEKWRSDQNGKESL